MAVINFYSQCKVLHIIGFIIAISSVKFDTLIFLIKCFIIMKGLLTSLVLFLFIVSSCSPRIECNTRSGKKKKSYYNTIQYGTNKSVRKNVSKSRRR